MDNFLSIILPLLAYILGLATGTAAVWFGFRLGFRASYEIRQVDGPDDKGLFRSERDAAEFDLLDEEDESK